MQSAAALHAENNTLLIVLNGIEIGLCVCEKNVRQFSFNRTKWN